MPVKDGAHCAGCGLPNYSGLCPVCRGNLPEAVSEGLWPDPREQEREREQEEKRDE